MKIADKYRLYPTPTQARSLNLWLDECRRLWNMLAAEVDDERHLCATLFTETEIRQRIRELSKTRYQRLVRDTAQRDKEWNREYSVGTPAQFLNGTIQNYQKALENFWRTKKMPPGSPGKVGYPRRKKRGEYTSVTWQDDPSSIVNALGFGRFPVPKLGTVKVEVHRELRGEPGTYPRIVRESDGAFYLVIPVEVSALPYPPTGRTVGVDLGVGVGNAYATSDGEVVSRPAWLRSYERKLRVLQRKASRRFRGKGKKQSAGWRKAVKAVAKLHAKVANQRRDWQHKQSMSLISRYDSIGMEDGNLKGWMGGGLKGVRKSSHDAAPGAFRQKVAYKASLYGRRYVSVNWDYTSQTCPSCGRVLKKKLSERTHKCECGCIMDRDVAAAIEIHRRSLLLNSDVTAERVGQTRRKPRKAKRQPVRSVVPGTVQPASAPVLKGVPGLARINEMKGLSQKQRESHAKNA